MIDYFRSYFKSGEELYNRLLKGRTYELRLLDTYNRRHTLSKIDEAKGCVSISELATITTNNWLYKKIRVHILDHQKVKHGRTTYYYVYGVIINEEALGTIIRLRREHWALIKDLGVVEGDSLKAEAAIL